MKRSATIFLQIVLLLIGAGTLAMMLWEPHLEGRNTQATTFAIYLQDPFLAYVYIASIAFFVSLYQVFKVLGHVGRNTIFSPAAVRALRTIKYCSVILIAFILGAEVYFHTVQGSKGEDIAGGVMIGLALMFIAVVIGTAAATFERILQKAVDLKSENDLTI